MRLTNRTSWNGLAATLLLLLLGACAHLAPQPGEDAGMPIRMVPSARPSPVLAVWYTGDGGFGATDLRIMQALADRDFTVVGVDSRKYFWRERSPEGAAGDLEALVARYGEAQGRPQLVLVGYSFGGAALPLIVARLSTAARARLRLVALVAPSRRGQLVMRPWNWLEIMGPHSHPTTRTVPAMGDAPVLCVYGDTDPLAACPYLPALPQVRVPGGHLFKGQAEAVAAAIARQVPQ